MKVVVGGFRRVFEPTLEELLIQLPYLVPLFSVSILGRLLHERVEFILRRECARLRSRGR